MSEFTINPYNFIPYGGNVERKQRNEGTASEPILTGEIKCSLTVKTPLAIPDAEERFMSKEKEDHYIYPFMTAGGVPIIPGSEIRGMVRNVFETITNSCFSIINCNTLSKRDGDPLPEAGLLQWDAAGGAWKLYAADRRSYFTPSTLKAAKARLDSQGKEYVERKWTLFPATESSWGKMKKTVNEAIEKCSTYQEFDEYLEKNGIYSLQPDDEDYFEGVCDDPVIVCWKKDYDKYGGDKTTFNTKRINIEKKWGPQYSYSKVVSHLGKPLGREYRENFFSVSLFLKKPDQFMILSEEKVSQLIDILDLYKLYNEAGAGQFNAVKPKKDGEMVPVFYDGKAANNVILAPSQITRKIYKNTVDKLLGRTKENPGHSPCKETGNLCPACRLFGTVMQSGGGAVSSKLRFSDATGDNVTLYPAKMDKEQDVPTLKELSSPKLTSIEFYSISGQNTGFTEQSKWNYDSREVSLRGRKVYLHNPKAELKSEDDPKHAVFCTSGRTKRNASMQLATDGTFAFSVYFNGITESELKTLVWALTLGDAQGDSSLHHKLGHGRPLGLGSVKLQVSEIVRRTTDGNSYCAKPETVSADYFNGFTLPIDGTDTLTALRAAFDFNYAGNHDVAYPIGTAGGKPENDNNSMQWFSLNHGKVGRNGNFKYVLHPIVVGGKAVAADKLQLPHLYKNGEPTGNQPYTRTGGSHSNQGNSRGNPTQPLRVGEEVDAVVTGSHSSKSGKLYIDFNASGNKGNLPAYLLPKDIPIGTTIRVRYKGKNGNGFDTYELVK